MLKRSATGRILPLLFTIVLSDQHLTHVQEALRDGRKHWGGGQRGGCCCEQRGSTGLADRLHLPKSHPSFIFQKLLCRFPLSIFVLLWHPGSLSLLEVIIFCCKLLVHLQESFTLWQLCASLLFTPTTAKISNCKLFTHLCPNSKAS